MRAGDPRSASPDRDPIAMMEGLHKPDASFTLASAIISSVSSILFILFIPLLEFAMTNARTATAIAKAKLAPKSKPKTAAKPAPAARRAPAPEAKAAVRRAAPVKAAGAAGTPKPAKQKLVRDSFTIPRSEYAVLDALKARLVELARPAKKSEVLRAGIKLLDTLPDAVLLQALGAVPAIKTGRPGKAK